jgi:hypothetical protein
VGSGGSYEDDLGRAAQLMPLAAEGFAASLTEAAIRFVIGHPAMLANGASDRAPSGPAAVRRQPHLQGHDNGARLAHIIWRERGRPPVAPPAYQGFGLRLLEQGLVQELDGTVQLAFHPEGLECRICLPVRTADQAATRRDVRNRTAMVLGAPA